MEIWAADWKFISKKGDVIIKDVITKRIPESHLHLHTDQVTRALRGFTTKASLADLEKDKHGKPKFSVTFIKQIGVTNGGELEAYM